jgi:hypothetical protein
LAIAIRFSYNPHMAESGPFLMYRVTLKTASGRSGGSDTAVVVPEGTVIPEKARKALYRFRVLTMTGEEKASYIVLGTGPEELKVSDMHWGHADRSHGLETTMHAKVAHARDTPLCFSVVCYDGSAWVPYAKVPATVTDGRAFGRLRVNHPLLTPDDARPSRKALRTADPALLRFTLEQCAPLEAR